MKGSKNSLQDMEQIKSEKQKQLAQELEAKAVFFDFVVVAQIPRGRGKKSSLREFGSFAIYLFSVRSL